jgi:hypothetical protein
VSSDKGTIHVFNLKVNVGSSANDKPQLALDPEVPHMNPPLSFIKGKIAIYSLKCIKCQNVYVWKKVPFGFRANI